MRLRNLVVDNFPQKLRYDVGSNTGTAIQIFNKGPYPLVSLKLWGCIHYGSTPWLIASSSNDFTPFVEQGSNPFNLAPELASLIFVDTTTFSELILEFQALNRTEIQTVDLRTDSFSALGSISINSGVSSVNTFTGDVVLTAADVGAIALADLPALSDELVIPFTYSSSVPLFLWSGQGFIRTISVRVTQPFSAGATLTIGTPASPALFLNSSDLDLSTPELYEGTVMTNLTVSTTLQAYLNANLSSSGAGQILITF